MSDDWQALRDITPEPERMLAVRRRVLTRIASESQPNWPVRLAWAFGLAVAATGLLSLWPETEQLDLAAVEWPAVVVRPPAFAYELTPPLPEPSAQPTPAPDIEFVRTEGDAHLLRLDSTDPDVILYYLLDTPGD